MKCSQSDTSLQTMNSKLFLLLAILVHVQWSSAAPKTLVCNSKTEKETEEMVGRILTIGTKRPFPENKAELKEYCKEQAILIDKVEQYKTQCLKGQSKNIVSVITYSIKSTTNGYCKNPNSKRATELVDSAKCANRATYGKCQHEFIDRIWSTESLKSQDKLAHTCCGYVDVAKCIRIQSKGVPECTEKRIELNHQYIKRFFDAAVDVICGDYNESTDKCDKLRKPSKPKTGRTYPPSFYGPLVKVLSEL